jgi:hypothetical protein
MWTVQRLRQPTAGDHEGRPYGYRWALLRLMPIGRSLESPNITPHDVTILGKCSISTMCDQLEEQKKCSIFPEDKESQAYQQEWEHERASAFEYLSDSREVRDRISKDTPHSYKQEKENQKDSYLDGRTMSKQGNIDTKII